ncbi:hypothetical protein Tco_0357632 [Tanacetum coccineum]
MENSKKGYTPMMKKPDYRKSQGAKTLSKVQRMLIVPYASAIGSIMYAVRCIRPDVAFVQNLCSCFQQNPSEIHWTAVKTILKYLRNTKDMVLVYGKKPEAELKISCYADASFQTDRDDTKSQTGYVFMRKFIDGLGDVVPSNKRPIEMLCDNEPAIAIGADLDILKGARHFQRKYHYIREVIQEREIFLKKVHTYDNVVDPFTKPMSFNKQKTLKKFRMENSKKGYTLMMEKPDYKKSQGAKTPSEVQRMQRIPYASAIEAEYIVAAEASMEAVWMRKFIDGLGDVIPSNKRPMEMLHDNEPTIAIANDPCILKGARHFQMKYHYIREVIQEREIVLKKVHTDDNVANPFIKPMSFNKHFEHAMAIGIVPTSSLM